VCTSHTGNLFKHGIGSRIVMFSENGVSSVDVAGISEQGGGSFARSEMLRSSLIKREIRLRW